MPPTTRYVAALIAFGCFVLCATLWCRSHVWSDTVVMPLLPPWSVRLHNGFGTQALQFIPEYNSLPVAIIPALRLSAAKPHLIEASSWSAFPSPWTRFELTLDGHNYILWLPCWFTTAVSFFATLLLLFGHRFRSRTTPVREQHNEPNVA